VFESSRYGFEGEDKTNERVQKFLPGFRLGGVSSILA
jgi:hypothetical protein